MLKELQLKCVQKTDEAFYIRSIRALGRGRAKYNDTFSDDEIVL